MHHLEEDLTEIKDGLQTIFTQMFKEQDDMYKEFEEDIDACKVEQNNIRTNLQALSDESKNSIIAMHDDISRIHLEECNKDVLNQMSTILQEKKEIFRKNFSVIGEMFQLMCDKIYGLSQKLETERTNYKDVHNLQKIYEERQANIVKSYSNAIKALEAKLLKSEDKFAQQQSLWMTDKETIEKLKREKQEMENKFQDFQQTIKQKDENNEHIVQSLTEELSTAKAEIQRLNQLNLNLEKRVIKSIKVVNTIIGKDEGTKSKMDEALELIDIAVREKNVVLEKEAKVVEQNAKLETQLASITKEYDIKLQEETAKLKDTHEHDVKNYLLEIKQLKSELREKLTLLDKSQRDNELLKMQMEDERRAADMSLSSVTNHAIKMQVEKEELKYAHQDDVKRYLIQIEGLNSKFNSVLLENMTLLNHPQKEKELLKAKLEDQNNEKLNRLINASTPFMHGEQFGETSYHANSKTCNEWNLEENLVISNDEKQSQQQNPTNCIKLADERTKDDSELIQAMHDKESLTTKLKSLQKTFDSEISKRDKVQHMLEEKIYELEMNKIRLELEMNLIKKCTKRNKAKVQKSVKCTKRNSNRVTKKNKSDPRICPVQVSFQHCVDTISKHTSDIRVKNVGRKWRSLLIEKMKEQQECFDKKIEEMKYHVTNYQNLSKRWADEAKSLTGLYQVKCKKLYEQISTLQLKISNLENKLPLLNQEDITFKSCAIHSFTKGFETSLR
ncbi:uncharacterized protein [Anoplolepis gracilipes]|uniref:uncharacterized protein n=1 Tax=Anoplolepis gracilipes TaxID=354296 RepID=UPI003BA23A6D